MNDQSTFDKKSYDIKYAREKLKRIPLDVRKEEYDQLEQIALAKGEKIQTYIKKAIAERAEKDGFDIFSKYRTK